MAHKSFKAASSWPTYTDVLLPYLEKVPGLPGDFKDPLLRQETLKWVFSQAAQGYFGLMYQDTEYPDFWPVYNQAFNFGFPNPDDSYYMAVVDDDGVYKISGVRGTVRVITFQIGTNLMMCYGVGSQSADTLSPPSSEYEIDDLHVSKDGAFEVVLSASRPQGYTGDWWKLEPKSTFILVRQRAYDWLAEVDGRFAIERLDRPAIKPRESADEIEKRLRQMSDWMETWTHFMPNFAAGMRKRELFNKLAIVEQPGGIVTQKYVMGLSNVADDEALILETELPSECRYWMFHVTDEMMASIDPMNRQTSLNGHTAQLDVDGKFRAVICAKDPGVPNWLDTAGYTRGGIVGRFMGYSSCPQPIIKKVSIGEVRRHLPAHTPSVTAEQRDAIIRLRRKGAQLRRRW